MSWSEVPDYKIKSSGSLRSAVTVRTIEAHPERGARHTARLTIAIRPRLIGEEASWIQRGARYRLLLGSGEHAGMLRIEPSKKGWMIGQAGGSNSADCFLLIIKNVPWIPSAKNPLTAVDHDSGDGWLEITLPDWAQGPAGKMAAAPTQRDVAPPKGRGYSMLGGKL